MPAPTNWELLASSIVERYPDAVAAGPDAVRVVLASRSEPTVRIGVRLRATTAYGSEVVVISAYLGPADRIDPWIALASNDALVHGALAIAQGVLVFRAVIATAGLTAEAFDLRVCELAAEAAELKRLLPGSARPSSCSDTFAHLAA